MSTDNNKTVIRRLIEEGLNRNNVSVVDDLIAPDYVSHGEVMEAAGPEAFKQIGALFRIAFPDGWFQVDHYVAEGDLVVTWGTFTGTHQGTLEGMPASGKPVRVKDVDLWRLNDGKVVETWTHFDYAGMMQQLGATPMAEAHDPG